MNELQLSKTIEQLLVARNRRHMKVARAALQPGYYLRAAGLMRNITGTVIIGTGFPVSGTFETDGPVGAMALSHALTRLGARPVIACCAALSRALAPAYEVLELTETNLDAAREAARIHLRALQPQVIVAIESPGLAADGRYYNMRGVDISADCKPFDPFVSQAECPTIAVGDGGNEIGMGNIANALAGLDIIPSVTGCDELLVADVSNWGAYGILALLALWAGEDLLGSVDPVTYLNALSSHGSVDGVTGENTLTEDGMSAEEGLRVIAQLRQIIGFSGS
jgi:hypothetical protein